MTSEQEYRDTVTCYMKWRHVTLIIKGKGLNKITTLYYIDFVDRITDCVSMSYESSSSPSSLTTIISGMRFFKGSNFFSYLRKPLFCLSHMEDFPGLRPHCYYTRVVFLTPDLRRPSHSGPSTIPTPYPCL